MAKFNLPSFYIGLRFKLVLVSLVLLAIPWAAYQSANEVEEILRTEKEKSLLSTTKAMAAVLNVQKNLFENQLRIHKQQDHYAHRLKAPIQVDGYDEDWSDYLEQVKWYSTKNTLKETESSKPSIKFNYLLGIHKNTLYMLIHVIDDKIVYRDPTQANPFNNDHIILAIKDHKSQLKRYIISTEAPGWILTKEIKTINTENGLVHLIRNTGIGKGEWKRNEAGYTVELRIPLNRINNQFALNVIDVDDAIERETVNVIGTSQSDSIDDLGHLLIPPVQLVRLLAQLDTGENRMIVLDRFGQVLAVHGSLQRMQEELKQLQREQEIGPFSLLIELVYSLVLSQPTEYFDDKLSTQSRIESEIIQNALQGKAATTWRASTDQQVSIVSAAHPIYIDNKVAGVLLLEETSNSILSAQNKAVQRLFNIIFIGMSIAMLAIFYYTSRLSNRITALKSQVEKAINSNGQILGSIQHKPASDELGTLSNSFSSMLTRLQEYTRYLETMASKLSHELRTPLAVVKSSLENLSMTELNKDAEVYKDRAADGAKRLSTILTGLSEATRLEQALQGSEKETFNLVSVVSACIDGYRQIYSHQKFTYQQDIDSLSIYGVPEFIAQLLDKLISNAVDFCEPGKTINIELKSKNKLAILSVSNPGPILAKEMRERLFDSMVSLRNKKEDIPHLGLGLFIVKLITEFHLGSVEGGNLEDESGVFFRISLPISQE